MQEIFIAYYKSYLGELILGTWQESLVLCDWRYRKMRSVIDDRMTTSLRARFVEQRKPLHDWVIDQLEAYFERRRTDFDLPLKTVGTPFQSKVWDALLEIPYGSTETYLQLAQRLGDVKAIRAVASANGANALSILIPCHRVIGSNGRLTGYAGGLKTKEKLLQLEGARMSGQMDLFEDVG